MEGEIRKNPEEGGGSNLDKQMIVTEWRLVGKLGKVSRNYVIFYKYGKIAEREPPRET